MPKLNEKISYQVKDDKLILTIDLSGERRPSKSGKSMIIATTSGNVAIDLNGETAKLGLNLYTPL